MVGTSQHDKREKMKSMACTLEKMKALGPFTLILEDQNHIWWNIEAFKNQS